ncbi:hypothetical protein RintRC_4850 [Richelia intracellularis]|nr:hypothetical protein RintRC_4850 [Richelia intracellularis]
MKPQTLETDWFNTVDYVSVHLKLTLVKPLHIELSSNLKILVSSGADLSGDGQFHQDSISKI